MVAAAGIAERSGRGLRLATALVVAAVAALVAPAGAHALTALNIPCAAPQDGVVFCQGDSAHRVAAVSTDKHVLLDVDVALPAGAGGNLPLVIQMHGWGGQKDGLAKMKPWAQRGYAVLNYTSRGFNGSCGSLAARGIAPPDPVGAIGCEKGWIKLMDTRYEIRDAQELAGDLADEGLVDGQRVASVGASYGGGFSMALAALKDRVMNVNDSLAPWTSPGGKPMRIAAAAPEIPWTDLVYSLMPNGRTLDYTITGTGPNDDRSPIGVMKQSFVSGLYALGQTTGFYAPPGMDSQADLNQWYAVINAGDPYDSNPQAKAIVDEIANHHSSYYIPDNEAPAPLFISNGFTDDLFPVDEALRYYNRLRLNHPDAPIKLMFFDWGHARGAGKDADLARLQDATFAWFDHYLRGVGPTPANDVTALTQTCPQAAASGGPFTAPTWDALHPGEVRLLSAAGQTILSGGGDPSVSSAVDPIASSIAAGNHNNPCASTESGNLNGTATYRFPAAAGGGYTLMGSPTVIGKFNAQGAPGTIQIAARLWDVAPGAGRQTLVARALYRPTDDGSTEVFQLHPNAWRFAPGHQAKLELLGNDAPYGRASNGAFSITATSLDLRLPVHDQPGAAGGQVQSPAAPFVPTGARLARGTIVAGLRVRYRRAPRAARRRHACRWRSARVTVTGRGLGFVRRVDFLIGSRRFTRDGRAPFAGTVTSAAARRAHSRRLRAVLRARDGRRITLRRTLGAC